MRQKVVIRKLFRAQSPTNAKACAPRSTCISRDSKNDSELRNKCIYNQGSRFKHSPARCFIDACDVHTVTSSLIRVEALYRLSLTRQVSMTCEISGIVTDVSMDCFFISRDCRNDSELRNKCIYNQGRRFKHSPAMFVARTIFTVPFQAS